MYAVLLKLLHPFPWLLLGVGAGLLVLARRSPPARWKPAAAACYALLLLDCLPVAAWCSAGLLEWQFPRVEQRPPGTRVIVVLGGGAYAAATPHGIDRLGESSLLRADRAAEVYRAGSPCPVIVSGGLPDGDGHVARPARLMAAHLQHAGVAPDDLIIEDRSRNTAENARLTAAILRQRGWTEGVVLVTSATHLPRSAAYFRKEGVEVIPVGCKYGADECERGLWGFWPSSRAASIHQEVLHELLGLAWGKLRGTL